MKHVQQVTIEVNGKKVIATVQVDAVGLETEDCVSPQMILSAIANNQNQSYHSRHHTDRVATIKVRPTVEHEVAAKPAALRLVA